MYEHFPKKSIIAFIMGYEYAKVGRHFHNVYYHLHKSKYPIPD